MMEPDVNDSGPGHVDSCLNGATKPDHAKLAQSAIIKQDVMLSGTSTQSPMSTGLAIPSVTMPTMSMATSTMASSLTGVLPESLFLGAVPSDTVNHISADSYKQEPSGTFSSHLSAGLTGQHQQLLGQPAVAPQYILAGQTLSGQASQASPAAAAASLPMQQLIIPVSTGNGTQQLISIPISLAAGAGGQIQLLTTSNGQLIATNLANLAQPMNIAMPNAGGSAIHPLLLMAPPNAATSSPTQQASTPSQPTSSQTYTQVAQQHAVTAATQNATAQVAAAAAAAQMPQLIANAQGQIVAIGTPQVLPPAMQTVTQSASALVQQHSAAQLTAAQQTTLVAQQAQPQVVSSTTAVNPHTLTPNAAGLSATAIHHQMAQLDEQPDDGSMPTQSMAGSTATVVSMSQPISTMSHHAAVNSLSAAAAAGVTPNINQLLPNTISSAAEGTIVDGVNLDEIREFAKRFKIWRLSLGLTQTQVGQALSAREGPSYSQSAICRFEKLDITPKSAQKIKPVLERWMAEAEERYKNGMQNLSEFIGSEPSKKRKRRTSFTPQALEVLNEHFERNTHPSGAEMTELAGKLNYNHEVVSRRAEMTELAEKLSYDREVIRVWFCNKRQALKNTIKKLKCGQEFS